MKSAVTRSLAVGIALLVVAGALAHEPSDREIVERFHKMFYEGDRTWNKNHWLGIEVEQNPSDAWIVQELIVRIRPDYVIETGTARGGSAVLWASVLAYVNPRGKVVTIDVEDQTEEARKLELFRKKVEFILGSSTDPKIVADLARRTRGKRVLVILDSDHSKDHVLAEIRAYAPMVSPESYIVVQDTDLNGHPVFPGFGPGPMEAVDEFLATTDRFRPDPDCERFLFTMHPRGYLKRVK